MGRISTSPRNVIGTNGPDMLSLGELGWISSAFANLVLLGVLKRRRLVGVSGTCTN